MVTRIAREQQTIASMLRIYCNAKHGTQEILCSECQELYEYALQRLDKCRFGEQKPVCGNCPIHCYKPAMRQRVVEVMRFSGPRMLFKHPILAIHHLLDSRIKVTS